MTRITAILLCRDEAARTRSAVQALGRELRRWGGELRLVDQASDPPLDGLIDEAARAVPSHVLRSPANETFAVAANRAARGVSTEFLLFLDNDTEVLPGLIEALLSALRDDVHAAAAGPKLVYPTGQIQEAGLALPLWLVPVAVGSNARGDDHRYNFPRSAFAVSTSCLLVRRPAFEEVGGFDQGYAWGFEAADLALSFRAQGWKVLYEPRAACVHEGGVTLARFPELTRQGEANRKRFLERWGVPVLRQVAGYLDQLSAEGARRFLIYGTGESARHLANTLEIGGYPVEGFVSPNGVRSVGRYPAWNVREVPRIDGGRVLIGSPYVREAEDVLAENGLLAGAALPILIE